MNSTERLNFNNSAILDDIINSAKIDPKVKEKKIYKKALDSRFLSRFNHGEYYLALKDAKKIVKIKPSLGHYYLSLVYKKLADHYTSKSQLANDNPNDLEREAKTYFKDVVKLYRKERNVSGIAFRTADIFINWLSPPKSSNEVFAVGLKARAKMFLIMQSPTCALEDLNEAKKLTPNKVGIYRQLAAAYIQMASIHHQKVLNQ